MNQEFIKIKSLLLSLMLIMLPVASIASARADLTLALKNYQQRQTTKNVTGYLLLLADTGDKLEDQLLAIGPRHQVLDYLFVLESMVRQNPKAIVSKLMQLNLHSQFRSGIISEMQLVSAKVYQAQTREFVLAMKQLNEKQQGRVIAFLAAGRQASAPGYRHLMRVLRSMGEKKLADLMMVYQK